MNQTKEGIEVKPGQIWEDLDPRMCGRKVYVLAVENGKALICNAHRHPRPERHSGKLSVNRMHKHATGFRLVDGAERKETP